MATVNIGRIKFVWQGAYSGGSSYVPDDIVSYNGSSYVCTASTTGNLPTDTTYWSVMASKGTDGTDITSLAGLAQGDILYYDGSNWVRLGAGTAGQVLQTGGAGANPSWGTVSSDYVKLSTITLNGTSNTVAFENVFDNAYQEFIITGNNIYTSTANQDSICLRFGTGATPSYATSNYHITFLTSYASVTGSNSFTSGQAVSEPQININRGLAVPRSTQADSALNFKATFFDLNKTTSFKRVSLSTWGGEHSDFIGQVLHTGLYRGTGTTTGIQFFHSSGNNFNGTLTLYGVK